MSILMSVLLVLFVIVSVLLIFLISIQDEKQSGLSGVFGGRGGSTFGSQTSSIVVKITTFFSVLFFVLALSLAVLHKISSQSDSLLRKNIEMNPITSVDEAEDYVVPSDSSAKIEESAAPANSTNKEEVSTTSSDAVTPVVSEENKQNTSGLGSASGKAEDVKENAIEVPASNNTNAPVVE